MRRRHTVIGEAGRPAGFTVPPLIQRDHPVVVPDRLGETLHKPPLVHVTVQRQKRESVTSVVNERQRGVGAVKKTLLYPPSDSKRSFRIRSRPFIPFSLLERMFLCESSSGGRSSTNPEGLVFPHSKINTAA